MKEDKRATSKSTHHNIPALVLMVRGGGGTADVLRVLPDDLRVVTGSLLHRRSIGIMVLPLRVPGVDGILARDGRVAERLEQVLTVVVLTGVSQLVCPCDPADPFPGVPFDRLTVSQVFAAAVLAPVVIVTIQTVAPRVFC